MISFIVQGQPVAKGRPRVCGHHTFTPKKTKDYEELVKYSYIAEHGKTKLDGALKMTIIAYFKIPKSDNKATKLLKADNVIRPISRPDADNVAKSITDGLNGVAYDDDSQIVELYIRKLYSFDPMVEVVIEVIP